MPLPRVQKNSPHAIISYFVLALFGRICAHLASFN